MCLAFGRWDLRQSYALMRIFVVGLFSFEANHANVVFRLLFYLVFLAYCLVDKWKKWLWLQGCKKVDNTKEARIQACWVWQSNYVPLVPHLFLSILFTLSISLPSCLFAIYIQIFVPIHREIHWCLAIIDVKKKKFQYLDSLGGMDTTVLQVLVCYKYIFFRKPKSWINRFWILWHYINAKIYGTKMNFWLFSLVS